MGKIKARVMEPWQNYLEGENMKERRSEADRIFGELVKKAIDESDEELDFFKRMSKVEIPPPETFMIGKPGRPWWKKILPPHLRYRI